MRNSSYVKSKLAQLALEFMPPLIRKTLLEEASFREEYSLRADAILSFGDSGVFIQRSDLFEAIRKVLSGATDKVVTDTVGRQWRLKNINVKEGLPSLELSRDDQIFILPDFISLSPDSITRLRSFDKAASDVNLPNDVRDEWRNILAERPLEEDEVDAFHEEFRDIPMEKARSIHDGFISGQIKISSLVPNSRRYFERLVGKYVGSSSINEYAAGSGRTHVYQLFTWQPYEGFLYSLLLSSHSSLTAEIDVDWLSSEDLLRAFDFLEKQGDRISQIGAIEVGFRILPSRPEIEPFLIRLIEQIRDDDVDNQSSGFKLLWALFVLVYGELSRIRLLSEEPPFFRKLAALSQAALIHRQLLNSAVDIDHFCKWALSNRGEQFYMQAFADMRLEPYWSPDLAEPSQLKADFLGRIMIAAKNHKQNIKEGELFDLILAIETESLHNIRDYFLQFLPGPLEGTEGSRSVLPTSIAEAIETQLRAEDVGPSSFFALVNSSLIFRVDAGQAGLAARTLKLGNYRIANVADRSQLLTILYGLATVAGVARSKSLADELRILIRRYRLDAQYALSVEEVIRICLVAAVSCSDTIDWRNFVGEWLTELAFSDLEGDESIVFYSHLQCLFQAVPELWVSCGRADAALIAYNTSLNVT